MKKMALVLLAFGVFWSLVGCGTSGNQVDKTTTSTLVVESAEDASEQEEKKMEVMNTDLEENGVEISYYDGDMYLSREKGIDFEYFKLAFRFDPGVNELFDITLVLKGNIDGQLKDTLHYEVSQGRIVEKKYRDSDITLLAEVLESIGYSDKELVEFAWWYFENNK